MSIEGQCHFFTIYFPGFVCFVLYKAKISGERLQDYWSSGFTHQHQKLWCSFREMKIDLTPKISNILYIFQLIFDVLTSKTPE